MKNIAIIDLESQGSSTSYAKIISIAGILVSPELQILDKFEFYCSSTNGYIPDPYSLWVNKGLKRMKESNMSHYKMMTELHKYIKKWSPCVWASWNGIQFDYIMIQKENYRSLFPIYITNTNGSEHSDFLPVARAAKLFYPDSIETNYSAKGNPVFKLDDLGPKNFPDLDQSLYHTAIMDCTITLKVMKKLKDKAKLIYEDALKTTGKLAAKNLIEETKLFTTVFYYFGKARPYAATYLCDHGAYTWPMVYCLEADPKDLISLDYKSLKAVLKKPGKFVRALPLKHPLIFDISYALKTDIYKTIGIQKLNERANLIKNNKEFSKNVSRALGEIAREKQKEKDTSKLNPHDQLYALGFPTKSDQLIMEQFHKINDWTEKYKILSKLKDQRFIYFGKRLIFQNEADVLPKKEYDEINQDIAHKVLNTEENRFTTIPMAEKLIDDIRNEKDISKEKLDYINEVDELIGNLRSTYEKVLKKNSIKLSS